MVINPTKVIMDSSVGSLIYHEVMPIATSKKENSLICPIDIPVRKLFFLVCPRNPSTIIVMIGLTISTKTTKINSGTNIATFVVAKFTCEPSRTKKITIKKSLSGFILLVISNLYDEFAKLIHAIRVHISIPKPIRWNNAQRIKHRPIENKNKYSWDSAIFLVIMGMKYLLTKYIPTANPITFAINPMITMVDDVCSMPLNVAIHKMSSITIKSCTISMPILNLPYVDSISSLSPNNFNTTIVLLKANPIPKKLAVMVSNHKNVAIKYPVIQVITTWKNHAISAVFPRSFMIVGLSSIPTINSSKAIPKFPNDWKAVFACNNHGINKLIAVPAIIYQIIIGCLNAFIKPTLKSTIQITILSEINICSVIRVVKTKA